MMGLAPGRTPGRTDSLPGGRVSTTATGVGGAGAGGCHQGRTKTDGRGTGGGRMERGRGKGVIEMVGGDMKSTRNRQRWREQ